MKLSMFSFLSILLLFTFGLFSEPFSETPETHVQTKRQQHFSFVCLKFRPPLWSSGYSPWLQNGDVLCFLRGTN
jgi:hypothetical protein